MAVNRREGSTERVSGAEQQQPIKERVKSDIEQTHPFPHYFEEVASLTFFSIVSVTLVKVESILDSCLLKNGLTKSRYKTLANYR